MKSKLKNTVFLFSLYQIPVALLNTRLISYQFRYYVLFFMSIIIIAYSISRRFKLFELGIRIDNIYKSLVLNILFSILIVFGLYIFYVKDFVREPTIPNWNFFFIFYMLFSSPLQEFLFRSVFFAELRKIGYSEKWQILMASLNYALMHSFYHDLITLIAASFMGFFLSYIYAKTNNLFGVILSHSLVGAFAIYVGLI